MVSVKDLLGLFGAKPHGAVKSLQKYINDGDVDHNETFYMLKDSRILGDNDFVEESVKTGDAKALDFEYYNADIDDAVKITAKHMNLRENEIKSITRTRYNANARGIVAYICKTMCGKTAKEVGQYLGRGESVLSDAIKRVELGLAEKGNDMYKVVQLVKTEIKKTYRPCLVRVRQQKGNDRITEA